MALWDKGERDRTQNEKILNHLKLYGVITSMEAFRTYNITRLSGRIYELRAQGYKITVERRKAKNGAMYAVYRLQKGEE